MSKSILKIRVSSFLIERGFREGREHKACTVVEGLPPDYKLVKVEMEDTVVVMWFAYSVEDAHVVKDIQVIINTHD